MTTKPGRLPVSAEVIAEHRTGPGRPSTGTRVEVRLSDAEIARLDRIAREQGVSRAEVIRQLVAARTRSTAAEYPDMTTTTTEVETMTGPDLVILVLDLIRISRPEVRDEIAPLKDFLAGYLAAVNDQAWETGLHRPLTGLAADRLRRARQILADVDV